jgi:hypothetical protein
MTVDKALQTKLILMGVGALLIVLFLNKILGMIGIRRSAKQLEKDEAEETLLTMPYFDPLYHTVTPHKELGESAAGAYAKDLQKAVSFIGTNEDLIYSTFGKLSNKTQISEIADQFYKMKRKDLRARLLKDINRKEQVKLYNIIKQLPNV